MSEAKKRTRIKKTAIITVLATENPKRPNSMAAERFALYKTGMTVAEYVEAGGRSGDLHYDIANGHIEVKAA